MLILTRKIGESVVIGDVVYCTVMGINADVVKLAIDAPRIMPIHRDEIQRRIWWESQKNKGSDNFDPEQEDVLERLINQFKQQPQKMPLSV
ncbi:global regulator [Legionella birminghamensis]|uniref:Translational regulator CsrA n=1 Tax=Legionella birminghamensis TaxID=28083 RepID=A0A378JTV7_9GAMM|nr:MULTISPECIES: carbon storage regulator [Legionella]KTC71812.1 global regulator [Legionella birminghamensis]MCW8452548.1 carbon storage regulator [Legionella quinlivanii]STX60832.1 global regulator [Legionella birminghamensis]